MVLPPALVRTPLAPELSRIRLLSLVPPSVIVPVPFNRTLLWMIRSVKLPELVNEIEPLLLRIPLIGLATSVVMDKSASLSMVNESPASIVRLSSVMVVLDWTAELVVVFPPSRNALNVPLGTPLLQLPASNQLTPSPEPVQVLSVWA